MNSRLEKAWRQVRWSIVQRGFGGTMRVAVQRIAGGRKNTPVALHPFDEQYGVDTSGLISGGGLAEGHVHDRFSVAYYGISPSRLQNALERWRSDRSAADVGAYTFLDVGSGKGRAMMLASELPFREIVGMEINAGLVETARRNLLRWNDLHRAICPVTIFQGDAIELSLPKLPLLVYLYNPFRAPVMRKFLKRLDEMAGARTGCIDVLYVVPEEEAVFLELPQFKLLWSERIVMSERDAAADLVSSMDDRCSLYRR